MATFKAFFVAALIGGLAVTMNFKVEKPTSENSMMVNTPVATL